MEVYVEGFHVATNGFLPGIKSLFLSRQSKCSFENFSVIETQIWFPFEMIRLKNIPRKLKKLKHMVYLITSENIFTNLFFLGLFPIRNIPL